MTNVMFEDFRQAQAEIERLRAERDLARDQAASAAGALEQAEADAYQLRCNVRTWQERWEREQAEIERLTTMVAVRDDLNAETVVELEQALARMKALEARLRQIRQFTSHGSNIRIIVEAALAAPVREGDADADPV